MDPPSSERPRRRSHRAKDYAGSDDRAGKRSGTPPASLQQLPYAPIRPFLGRYLGDRRHCAPRHSAQLDCPALLARCAPADPSLLCAGSVLEAHPGHFVRSACCRVRLPGDSHGLCRHRPPELRQLALAATPLSRRLVRPDARSGTFFCSPGGPGFATRVNSPDPSCHLRGACH